MTSENDAFLSAICTAPDDNVPRLIFADWLDEHGESARAEFIRVQVDLALRTSDFGPHWRSNHEQVGCQCELCILRRRERELYQFGLWNGWLNFGICRTETATFRRGFIDEVSMSWEQASQHVAAIRAACPLKRVRLTTWPEVVANVLDRTAALDGCDQRPFRVTWKADDSPRISLIQQLLAAEFPPDEFGNRLEWQFPDAGIVGGGGGGAATAGTLPESLLQWPYWNTWSGRSGQPTAGAGGSGAG